MNMLIQISVTLAGMIESVGEGEAIQLPGILAVSELDVGSATPEDVLNSRRDGFAGRFVATHARSLGCSNCSYLQLIRLTFSIGKSRLLRDWHGHPSGPKPPRLRTSNRVGEPSTPIQDVGHAIKFRSIY